MIGISTNNIKTILEMSILNTLFPFLNDYISTKKPWKPSKIFQYIAFNTVYHMNFGEPTPFNDPRTNEIIDYNIKSFRLIKKSEWLSIFPFLDHISSFFKAVA